MVLSNGHCPNEHWAFSMSGVAWVLIGRLQKTHIAARGIQTVSCKF